ncbi:TonB-dependent receptor [Parasphingorhabdus litoris]|uniref:TonB-dependent receptor n=1 Tax=Parasphingorhabdus litoris TaxID=394733 RepID=A0ABP3KSN6_9SPHN|nr:TonB-dependent receptor [Parasphingorhabdus litoris]
MKTVLKGLLLAATAATPTHVLAQDVGQQDAVESDNVIVVTARKREESLQNIPVAVSVFGEDLIDEANISGLEQISDFTPGFQLQSAFGRDADRPVIRGTSNILISEGKVGFFIDGVPFVGASTALDLENYRRVEVIKGPQSAVFGRGTLSGAVNYVSKQPTDELTADFELTAATHDDYEIFGRVAGPIADGLSGFVSGKYNSFGGDYTNSVTGNSLGQETLTISAGLNYQSDGFEASVIYLRTEDDDDHYAIGLQDSSFNNIFTEGSRGYFQGEVELREPIGLNTDELIEPGLNRKANRIIATATAELGDSGYTATALFGYTDITERTGTDQTFNDQTALFISSPFVCANFIPDCAFGVSPFNTDSEIERTAISAELRFASPQDKAIRFEIGGFFFDDQTNGTDYGRKQTEFGFDSISETDVTTNLAAFGSVEFDVTDRLTIGGELRIAREEIGTRPGDSYRLGDLFAGVTDPDRIIAGDGAVRNATFKSVLPRITVDYQANDDLLVYAKYSEGNSPGGFNSTDAPITTFGEESLKNYEVGIKSEPLDGLRVNLAGFFIDYGDQVLTSTFTTGAGGVDSFSDNIGDTEIYGLELDATWRVTDFLTLSGTYAYIDAEVTNGVSTDQAILLGGTTGTGTVADPNNPGATLVTTDGCTNPAAILDAGQLLGDGTLTTGPIPCATFADVSGQTPPLVSKHQATFSAAFDVPIGDSGWDIFARGDVIYRSSFFAQIHNLAETGDSTKVNFSAGVRKDNLTLRFWVKNAFQDETPRGILRYVDFSAPTLNGVRQRAFAITPPERRQFGVTLSGSF